MVVFKPSRSFSHFHALAGMPCLLDRRIRNLKPDASWPGVLAYPASLFQAAAPSQPSAGQDRRLALPRRSPPLLTENWLKTLS